MRVVPTLRHHPAWLTALFSLRVRRCLYLFDSLWAVNPPLTENRAVIVSAFAVLVACHVAIGTMTFIQFARSESYSIRANVSECKKSFNRGSHTTCRGSWTDPADVPRTGIVSGASEWDIGRSVPARRTKYPDIVEAHPGPLQPVRLELAFFVSWSGLTIALIISCVICRRRIAATLRRHRILDAW